MAKRYENRYGRGGHERHRDHAHDRGYMGRAADEVRSWFREDHPERRRDTGDPQRDRRREDAGREWSPSQWNRSSGSDDWRAETDWREGDELGDSYGDDPRRDWGWADRGRDRETSSPGRWRDWGGAWGDERNRWSVGNSWSGEHDGRAHQSDAPRRAEGPSSMGSRGFWGRGPKGYQRSDSRIQEDVCERLTYSDVDAENIEVTVANGEVTLSGSVRDRWDKRQAEELVEHVPGVRDVHNHIRVQRGERGGASSTSHAEPSDTVAGVHPTAGAHIMDSTPSGGRSRS
jgi:hypothetical protein